MKTISQAVEQVIARSPFFIEAISEGIANNAQVARKIKSDVEALLYEDVSEGAVVMALHRMAKNLTRTPYGARFLKRMSDITVRSNLVQFAFPNSSDALTALDVISKRAHRGGDTFFNLSRGLREVLIIVSEDMADEIARALKPVSGVKRMGNLSAITMHLPEDSLNVPGVYHPILKALAMEGISFVEMVSLRTEFTIIFDNATVEHAFSVIKRATA